ncbi:MAG: energy transducer TonB [Crocinitomicaceae bacterium]|nr:energy transducer TonB [Crocinitomicaceae bacterium]
MIAKKNKKANLERKRFAFFQIGLLVSGSLCLAAFEYSTVVPDEYQVKLEDDSWGMIEPIYEDQLPEDRPIQQTPPKVINYENVDSFIQVKELILDHNTYVSNKTDFIDIGDAIDPFGGINLGILPEDDDVLIDVPDIEPSFVGGETAMFNWIKKEVVYPEMCAEVGIQGMVYVQFEVATSGAISNVKVVQSPHEDLSKEAMRVVRKMPKWIPGEQAGKKVRTRFTLPVNFVLH